MDAVSFLSVFDTSLHGPGSVFSFGIAAERWATAAKAAEMIYLSSHYTVRGVPADFVWRLLDFVTYVLPLLVQLVEKPGMPSA
jgi:hypothetical protein